MRLTLIPSPFALDQHRHSMGRAPESLLANGLRESLESDGHTATIVERELDLGPGTVLQRIGRNDAILARHVAAAHHAATLPVILGGDCLVSIGAVAGLRRALDTDFGIAWFDAHGDFNTPDTTISGYLGGMPLACCCGRGLEILREAAGLERPVNEANVIMLGIRDLDPPEKALLDQTPVRIFDPAGTPSFVPDNRPTYLHFDIDAMDPSLAPGVNYLTPNGLSMENALAAAQKIKPHLAAFALTAVDPERDRDGQTVQTAIQLIRGILR
ncbi:MAG TPA: arginase family protein [Anaerolineales bacterium]|nr:arginase family protein [Anaerolineales bacterium]